MQEDTFRGDGLNLYTYVANNPIKYIDPTGHCKEGVDFSDVINNILKKITGFASGVSEYLIDRDDESEPTAYIFYALPDSQNGGFEERAKADAERWKEEMGTDAVLVPITSEEQFVEEWGKMGTNGETVQYVGLYFHSNPYNLFINTDNDEYITVFDSGLARGNSGPEATPISSLENYDVKIKNLYIYSCNSGHLTLEDTNLAATFIKNYDIESVYAWDGSMKWSKNGKYTRLAFSQSYYESYLSSDEKKRDPEGMVRYYKDSSGEMQVESVEPVSSERQFFFWKFDLWETRYDD